MRVDVEKIRGGPQHPDGARPSISERYEFFPSFYRVVYELQKQVKGDIKTCFRNSYLLRMHSRFKVRGHTKQIRTPFLAIFAQKWQF